MHDCASTKGADPEEYLPAHTVYAKHQHLKTGQTSTSSSCCHSVSLNSLS